MSRRAVCLSKRHLDGYSQISLFATSSRPKTRGTSARTAAEENAAAELLKDEPDEEAKEIITTTTTTTITTKGRNVRFKDSLRKIGEGVVKPRPHPHNCLDGTTTKLDIYGRYLFLDLSIALCHAPSPIPSFMRSD